jgi:hypothetical protein
MVNSSPANRASSGRRETFSESSDTKAVGDHDQELVAAGVAQAVVDVLETVEVDEQHRRAGTTRHLPKKLVRFRPEMKPVGKRGHGIVHAQSVGIFDRGADFREQGVDGGCKLGHPLANHRWRRRDQVAVFDCKQAVGERGQRAGAFAVRAFRRYVADEQAETAGGKRGDDLGVELRDVQERTERKDE